MKPVNRDLLFAALAARTSFVDRETLQKSVVEWNSQNEEGLAEHLVKSGCVSEATKKVLSAVVDEHVRLHGDDLDQQVANVLSQGDIGTDFGEASDPTVRQYLSQVAPAGETVVLKKDEKHKGKKLSQQGTPNVGEENAYGRYRIQKPLAKGGIGEIYRARDEELGRDVALKRIQQRHSSEAFFQDRFMLEAEVTGGLEHPNIVPVYGLGLDPDGSPFYAMRLIEGQSLAQRIATLFDQEYVGAHHAPTESDRSRRIADVTRGPNDTVGDSEEDANGVGPLSSVGLLEGDFESKMRRLLPRFVQVCQAIHYAHSRGVLHRDIKPDNIMLGPYGETLILDWGLAKIMGEEANRRADIDSQFEKFSPETTTESTPTLDGAIIGTVAYMSPEQSLGWHDSLTPASDVYSLGATLYTLMTGRRSVEEKDLNECLLILQAGEIEEPRHHNRQISPALNAICMKAMEKSASKRYSTALDLANDLEAYLADEPVSAYQDPLLTKVGRWARKHRAVTTGVGVGVLLVVISLSLGLVMSNAAKEREAALKTDAISERNRAKEYFSTAFEAVNTYLNQITEDKELAAEDLQPLRIRLLETALPYYEKLARQESDPLIEDAQADAYHRIGLIKDELGDYDAGKENFEKSLSLRDNASEEVKETDEWKFAVTQPLINLANSYDREGDTEKRNELIERASLILRELYKESPDDLEITRGLATVINNMSSHYLDVAEIESAKEGYLEAIELREKLVAVDEPDLDDVATLIETHTNLYILYSVLGDYEGASESLKSAKELGEEFSARDADNAPYLILAQVRVFKSSAGLKYDIGDYDGARPDFEAAIELMKSLVRDNPRVLRFQESLINLESNLAVLYSKIDELELAGELMDSAIERREKRYEAVPNDIGNYQDLAVALLNRSSISTGADDYEGAQELLKRSIAIHRELLEQFPDSTIHRAQLARTQGALADTYSFSGQHEEAEKVYQELVETYRELSRLEPEIVDHLEGLARTIQNLASYTESTEEMFERMEESIQIRGELLEQGRASYQTRLNYGGTHLFLGSLYNELGRVGEAEETVMQGIAAVKELLDENENDVEAQVMLGRGLSMLGDYKSLEGNWAEALAYYLESMELYGDRVPFYVICDVVKTLSIEGRGVEGLDVMEENYETFIKDSSDRPYAINSASLAYAVILDDQVLDETERTEKSDRAALICIELLERLVEEGDYNQASFQVFVEGYPCLSMLNEHPKLIEIKNSLDE